MSINIKRNQLKRVVIVGGGLGGLRLAEDLCNANLQVVLIDKNNFHQFPPLIYQIASAGIDPSSISFPCRQIFRAQELLLPHGRSKSRVPRQEDSADFHR